MLSRGRRLIKIVRAQFAWQDHAVWNYKSLGFCSKAEQLTDERWGLISRDASTRFSRTQAAWQAYAAFIHKGLNPLLHR